MLKIIHPVTWGIKQLFHASPYETSILCLTSLFLGTTSVVSIFLFSKIIGTISTNLTEGFPLNLLLALFAVLYFQAIAPVVFNHFKTCLSEKLLARIQIMLMKKANSFLGLKPFTSCKTQEEIEFLKNESYRRPMNFVYIIFPLLQELFMVIILWMFLYKISLLLSLGILLSSIPLAMANCRMETLRWDNSLFSNTKARKLKWFASVSLEENSARELRIFGFGNFFLNLYSKIVEDFILSFKKQSRRESYPVIALSSLTVIANFAIFAWVIHSSIHSQMDIVAAIFSIQAFSMMQISTNNILQDMAMLIPVAKFFERFRQFTNLQDTSLDISTDPIWIRDFKGKIEFRQVCFHYPNGQEALKNINFIIQPGEKIALVGENGSGKSTLIKLLMRFYDPTSGSIFIDDIDLRNIHPHSWHKQISAVFQDYAKYFLTIEENIALGVGGINYSSESLEDAARKGGAKMVADTFASGLSTEVGNEYGGYGLSEGQWQRISISRALMKSAKLLVLDEPSASLDPRIEQQLFESFSHHTKDKTALFITHRLGSVSMVDRVFMLKNGQLIQDGNHRDLMKTENDYSTYYSLQANQYTSCNS